MHTGKHVRHVRSHTPTHTTERGWEGFEWRAIACAQYASPRSLYFYNCAQVKPTWVRPEPASQPIDCGCSWSSLSGCRVSGEQLLAGLEALPGANPGCAGGGDAQHHEECALRQSMASTAGKYKHCFALDAPACAASPLCSWGEQSQGECGVNELHLLQTLAGPKLSKNPIIQAALQGVVGQVCKECCVRKGGLIYRTRRRAVLIRQSRRPWALLAGIGRRSGGVARRRRHSSADAAAWNTASSRRSVAAGGKR